MSPATGARRNFPGRRELVSIQVPSTIQRAFNAITPIRNIFFLRPSLFPRLGGILQEKTWQLESPGSDHSSQNYSRGFWLIATHYISLFWLPWVRSAPLHAVLIARSFALRSTQARVLLSGFHQVHMHSAYIVCNGEEPRAASSELTSFCPLAMQHDACSLWDPGAESRHEPVLTQCLARSWKGNVAPWQVNRPGSAGRADQGRPEWPSTTSPPLVLPGSGALECSKDGVRSAGSRLQRTMQSTCPMTLYLRFSRLGEAPFAYHACPCSPRAGMG